MNFTISGYGGIFSAGCFSNDQVWPTRILVGAAISLSGQHFTPKVYGFLDALYYWYLSSQSSYWHGGDVNFCILNDESNESRSREIYVNMAKPVASNHFGLLYPVHILIGPSTALFGRTVAQAVDPLQKVLCLWSVPSLWYDLPHTPGSSLCTDGRCRLPTPQTSVLDLIPKSYKTGVGTSVLDFTVPFQEFTYPALEEYYRSGARYAFIVSMVGSKCTPVQIAAHAKQVGYTEVHRIDLRSAYDRDLAIYWFAQLVSTRTVDVLIICGPTSLWDIYLLVFQALDINPKAIVITVPFQAQQLLELQPAYVMHGLVEPRPWQFERSTIVDKPHTTAFGGVMTYKDFADFFRKITHGRDLNMMTILTLSVVEVIWRAQQSFMQTWTPNTHQSIVSAMMGFVTNQSIPTLDGVKGFRSDGKCITCRAGQHQLTYLPSVGFSNATAAVERSEGSQFKIIARKNTTLPSTPGYQFMQWPIPFWRVKQSQIYPCRVGCEVKGVSCAQCPRGRWRASGDLFCRNCDFGMYADNPGQHVCKLQPEGSIYRVAEEAPQASPGWFRVRIDAKAPPACDEDPHVPVAHVWVRCVYKASCVGNNTCLGANTGIFCASCGGDYTPFGLYPTHKICTKCPSYAVLRAREALVIAMFLMFAGCLSAIGATYDNDPSCIITPMLIIMYRHFQLLGMLHTSYAMDVIPDSIFPQLPGIFVTILTIPLVAIQTDCIATGTEEHIGLVVCVQALVHLFGGYFLIFCWNCLTKIRPLLRTMLMITRHHEVFGVHQQDCACARAMRREILTHMSAESPMFRQMIAWSIVYIPSALQTISMNLGCVIFKGLSTPRILFHPDVECQKNSYKEWYRSIAPWMIAIGLLVPILLRIALTRFVSATQGLFCELHKRRVMILLIAGQKTTHVGYECYLMLMTHSVAILPALVTQREALGTGYVMIFACVELYSRWFRPRLSTGHSRLRTLDKISFYLLFATGLIGWYSSDFFDGFPIVQITKEHVPAVFRHISAFSNVVAVAHVAFAAFGIYSYFRDAVIVPAHLGKQVFYDTSFSGWLSRKCSGCSQYWLQASPVRVDTEDRIVDISKLTEQERYFYVDIIEQLMLVCFDSRDAFSFDYITWLLQETLARAGDRRFAFVNADQKSRRRRLRIPRLNVRRLHSRRFSERRPRIQPPSEAASEDFIMSSTMSTASDDVVDKARTMEVAGAPLRGAWKEINSLHFDEERTIMKNQSVRPEQSRDPEQSFNQTAVMIARYRMASMGITMDEMFSAFLDLEEDVMNYEPTVQLLTSGHYTQVPNHPEDYEEPSFGEFAGARLEAKNGRRLFSVALESASNVRDHRKADKPDIYCVVYDTDDNALSVTRTIQDSSEPRWNHKFMVQLRNYDDLRFEFYDRKISTRQGGNLPLGHSDLESGSFFEDGFTGYLPVSLSDHVMEPPGQPPEITIRVTRHHSVVEIQGADQRAKSGAEKVTLSDDFGEESAAEINEKFMNQRLAMEHKDEILEEELSKLRAQDEERYRAKVHGDDQRHSSIKDELTMWRKVHRAEDRIHHLADELARMKRFKCKHARAIKVLGDQHAVMGHIQKKPVAVRWKDQEANRVDPVRSVLSPRYRDVDPDVTLPYSFSQYLQQIDETAATVVKTKETILGKDWTDRLDNEMDEYKADFDLVFDAPPKEVHTVEFRIFLLEALHELGVPESLDLTISTPTCEGKVDERAVVRLGGPTEEIANIRRLVSSSEFTVMGFALLRHPGEDLKPSPERSQLPDSRAQGIDLQGAAVPARPNALTMPRDDSDVSAVLSVLNLRAEGSLSANTSKHSLSMTQGAAVPARPNALTRDDSDVSAVLSVLNLRAEESLSQNTSKHSLLSKQSLPSLEETEQDDDDDSSAGNTVAEVAPAAATPPAAKSGKLWALRRPSKEEKLTITTPESRRLLELLQSARFLSARSFVEANPSAPPQIVEDELQQVLKAVQLEEEDIHRINRHFNKNVDGSFVSGRSWSRSRNDARTVEFDYVHSDGWFKMLYKAEFAGVDPIRAIAAFAEMDFASKLEKDIESSNPLDQKCPADALWHVKSFTSHMLTKEDYIVHVSLIDALEEHGAFFVCTYTAEDPIAKEVKGVKLGHTGAGVTDEAGVLKPHTQYGDRFAGCWRTYRITPLRRPDSSDGWGFKLDYAYHNRTRNKFRLVWLPGPGDAMPVVETVLRHKMLDKFAPRLQELMKALDLDDSPRGSIYEKFRHHLRETLPSLPVYKPPEVT